jgi:disulfide bond formation protein DsbB
MLNAKSATLLVLIGSAATIAGAWAFQFWGYEPCHLCLLQRWPHYAAIVLAGLSLMALDARMQAHALKILGLLMLGSAIFGAYHAGIEWKFWPGPSTCTGTGGLTTGLPDLTKPVVMCDDAALRILGISLAGWNALISAALAAVAFSVRTKRP